MRAHEFISELPGGYEAPVNEAGTNLSVGQKQLLSFAGILLMDPRILILDEAAASIDTKTERRCRRPSAGSWWEGRPSSSPTVFPRWRTPT